MRAVTSDITDRSGADLSTEVPSEPDGLDEAGSDGVRDGRSGRTGDTWSHLATHNASDLHM